MLTYRVFYGAVKIEEVGTPQLWPTPEDAVSNGYALFKLLESKFSSGADLLFKLPDRRSATGKIDKRAVFIPRVKDYPTSGVIVFDFWKIHYDLDDRKIFDEAGRRVDHLKDLFTLTNTQGELFEGHCAYDYSAKTIIWRDINGYSKTDLEFCLSSVLGRKVAIVHLADTRADADFAAMDLESLSLDVETANIDGIAKIVTDSAIGRNSVSAKIADIVETTEAGRIKITIMADKKTMREKLKKGLLGEDVGVLRRMLALANAGRSRSNYHGQLRAEGTLPNSQSSNLQDKRVIDLFRGLLIRKLEIEESPDPSEQERIIDQAMIRFAQIGRDSQDGLQTISSE